VITTVFGLLKYAKYTVVSDCVLLGCQACVAISNVDAVPQVARVVGTDPPIPQAVDGERGQHDAALENLQDRAAAEAVMANRVGVECEPLRKSATADHGSLLS
jgi:hypothetical protein